jgi:hypothetical protein
LDILNSVAESLARDNNNIVNTLDEYVKLVVDDDHRDTTVPVPTDLMHAAHHFDGIPPCII